MNETTTIPFDTFASVDLRVGKVLTAERVEGSDKLLKLSVDLGSPEVGGLGTRQILSGIAKFYEPEKLIGTNVSVVANLAPRLMMGLESQGMILAVGETAILLSPASDVAPGTKIR